MILSIAADYAINKRRNKCLCDDDLFPNCDCGDYKEELVPSTKRHKKSSSSPANHQELHFLQQYPSQIYEHYGLFNKHVHSIDTSLPTPSIIKELVEHYVARLNKNRHKKFPLSKDIKVLDILMVLTRDYDCKGYCKFRRDW
jgi:hypothetical protein